MGNFLIGCLIGALSMFVFMSFVLVNKYED